MKFLVFSKTFRKDKKQCLASGITVTYIELKNYINRDSRVESLSSC